MPNDEVVELPRLSTQLVMTKEDYDRLQREKTAMEIANAYEIKADTSLEEQGVIAQEANNELRSVKKRIAEIEELREGFVAPARTIVKNAEALFNPALEALEHAETYLKNQLSGYVARVAIEQRRVEVARQEAERAARLKAQQEAEQARARAEEEARQKRAQAEEAAKRLREAQEAGDKTAAKKAAEDEARANAQAEAAIEKGTAKASAAIMSASAALPEADKPQAAKLAGFSTRKVWTSRLAPGVEDDAAALRLMVAAAAGVEPAKLARPDILALLSIEWPSANRLASALHDGMSIPGLEAYEKTGAASRK